MHSPAPPALRYTGDAKGKGRAVDSDGRGAGTMTETQQSHQQKPKSQLSYQGKPALAVADLEYLSGCAINIKRTSTLLQLKYRTEMAENAKAQIFPWEGNNPVDLTPSDETNAITRDFTERGRGKRPLLCTAQHHLLISNMSLLCRMVTP